MAGLIKQATQEDPNAEMPAEENAEMPAEENAEPAVEQTPAEEGGESQDLTPQAVRGKMNLPPELKDAYERVVLAGMKVMFDPSTHEMSMKAIQGPGPIDTRLARGVAALIGTLVKESNGTMPPPIIIPAGIELIAAAGDYLKKSGVEKVTDDDVAGAMADYVQIIFEQAGAQSPDQMRQMLQGTLGASTAAQPPAGPQAPAAPQGGAPMSEGA